VTDGRTDGENCDGYDALKAVAAFTHKKIQKIIQAHNHMITRSLSYTNF